MKKITRFEVTDNLYHIVFHVTQDYFKKDRSKYIDNWEHFQIGEVSKYLHNDTGPALIARDINSNDVFEYYYLDGKGYYKREDWEKEVK